METTQLTRVGSTTELYATCEKLLHEGYKRNGAVDTYHFWQDALTKWNHYQGMYGQRTA